jgi:serine/threonine protein kinase
MVAYAVPSRLRFGDYDIERKLGHGMTDVYLGYDSVRNRRAVLKLIRHGSDPATRQVIEAERRGASLQRQMHQYDARVIEVYDAGDCEGCFFVAMEYVEGENVAQILRRERRIEPARAARMAAEVAAQLESLHSFLAPIDGRSAAVVHGDIKPSNIQVATDGRIRLLDFGIAKCVTPLRNLTVHQFGSPNYCSPERLDRSEVDTDADLWSLGVTLYEMVAGAPPYQADSTRKLEELIQSKRPPRALPGPCPPRLKAIIGKALAADADERYGTATNLRTDLEAFLEGRATVAERERRRPWRVNPTVDAAGSSPRRPWQWRWPQWEMPRIPYTRVAEPLACVLLGMAVFLATGYYWRYQSETSRFRAGLDLNRRTTAEMQIPWYQLQHMRREFAFLGRFSPALELEPVLRAAYVTAADAIIDSYRSSSDPAPQKFDWPKAQAALDYAVKIDGSDQSARGKLALCRGYLAMESALDPPGAGSAASATSEDARAKSQAFFNEASAATPVSPDPHLGLARLYAYAFRDTDRALGELIVAEALGYRLQPREIEQKADAYRFRAWKELGRAWSAGVKPMEAAQLQALGQHDLEAAQLLYEQIPGFNHADAHLRQVRAVYAKTLPSPPVKPVIQRSGPRMRRWR